MTPTLNHTTVTSRVAPTNWLYMLHGIFGSGRNWATPARKLNEARPDWGIELVDLRLHGASTGFPPPHTVRACADDLVRLETEIVAPPTAILGHSFGGKVALLRAADANPELRQVWIFDSPLSTGEPSGGAWEVLQLVRSLPDRFDSRDQMVNALAEHGHSPGMGLWMAMNLERDGDSFTWRIDWEGVEQMLQDYHATDVWHVFDAPPENVDLHFVRAAASSAVDGETLERLRSLGEANPRVHLHEIAGGHWINVENPQGVQDLLERYLGGGDQ